MCITVYCYLEHKNKILRVENIGLFTIFLWTKHLYLCLFLREKKKEKDREELWRRLSNLGIIAPTEKDPQILGKTPLTSFVNKKEGSVLTSGFGDKSPNVAKRLGVGTNTAAVKKL
uniref:Ovule protein n=1 Tax=Syphacia muris TaxID=451379 RepID=A0A0N5AB71_9BILA